jgi:HD-GYP domain-containing protein (c-di-GMP phosphodiesterase class II)
MDLAESVLAHHERWDGKGYPKGIKGEEIPLLARIISIVESYDRMIQNSDNSEGMKYAEALEVIRENAGTQYDPQIAESFFNLKRNQFS